MDKALMERLIASYQGELAQLQKVKQKNAEEYSLLTDEELVHKLKKDTNDIFEDATKNDVTVGSYPVREC